MTMEAEDVIAAVEALLNSRPEPTDICECDCEFREHKRLGKRNIWVCKGHYWLCTCVEFVKRKT